MRLNYYTFPDNAPARVMVDEGCTGYLPDGRIVHWWDIEAAEIDWENVEVTDRTIEGVKVSKAKNLLKLYGGMAWTEHCERDGGCFEVTEITIKGNNSRFKYNHHL